MTGPKPIALFSLRGVALACLSAVMAVLSLAPPAGAAAKPVILDTDICDDIDDTWALALLLQSPELDCKLVTTAVGNTEAKARVVARFLDRVGRADIPVGIGVKQHDGTHRQMDWVQGYDLSTYPGIIHRDGVRALIDTVMNSPQRMTIIAIGPLPNIAAVLEQEPRIAEKADFVGMHGSIYKGYGGSDKPSAEYNVVADARACRKVFTAGWPITITPLDTCGLVHLRGDKYQRVLRRNSAITSNLIQNYRAWQADGLKAERKGIDAANLARLVNNRLNSASSTLFDTVAVYLAINTDLVRMERLPVEVTGDGYTKIAEGAKVINCAVDWKSLEGFEDFLVERLTK